MTKSSSPGRQGDKSELSRWKGSILFLEAFVRSGVDLENNTHSEFYWKLPGKIGRAEAT